MAVVRLLVHGVKLRSKRAMQKDGALPFVQFRRQSFFHDTDKSSS